MIVQKYAEFFITERMCRNVQERVGMCRSVQKCAEECIRVHKCAEMCGNVQKCAGVCRNVQERREMSRIVQKWCKLVLLNKQSYSQMLVGNGDCRRSC